MMRLKIFGNTPFFLGLLMLAGPGNVMALGMGEIDLKSALNQPFNAVVVLSSATDAELTELQIKVAPREMFSKAGLGWTRILNDLHFSAERTASGTPVIKITSTEPVSEPFLEIMLEVVWSRGRLIRTYTVLLDPPLTMPAKPVAAVVPTIPRPPVSKPAPVSEPPASVAPKTRTAKPAIAPGAHTPAPPAKSQVDRYGPVKRNETLWRIAKKVRPDSTVDINQTMIAILRANPDAFFNDNINDLKSGAVLRVPDRNEIASLGDAARSEVSRQYAEWNARRKQKQVAEAESAAEAIEMPARTVTETHLQLVAPEEGEVEAESGVAPGNEPGTDEAEAASDVLRQQLAQADEEVESGQAQTSEFQSRVNDLESQLERLQRLLELKDEQLASLQNRLGIEPEDQAVVETADEITSEADATDEDKGLNEPQGLIAKAIDNPVLTALIVISAMVLGGFFFASARQRRESSLFRDEVTPESRLRLGEEKAEKETRSKAVVSEKTKQESPGVIDVDVRDDGDEDPVTEADVFLAYGRTQQAETVLLSALAAAPEDVNVRMKLLEVYHASGDTPGFDEHFNKLQQSGAVGSDEMQKIMRMGHELAPQNQNYNEVLSSEDGDFDMDMPGAAAAQGSSDDNENGLGLAEELVEDLPESLEFSLDDDVEEDADGILADDDEVATKLDLARAYHDMGDNEGACRILKEVLEQGNDGQKEAARSLLSEYS